MFKKKELIRFQHCDPAGIVFYPRYVEMINATVEDWFAEIVGVSFAEVHIVRRMALPVVSLAIEFRSPSRLGDILDIALSVEKLGSTSISLLIFATVDGIERFTAHLTSVHISLEDYRPKPWPDDIRRVVTP